MRYVALAVAFAIGFVLRRRLAPIYRPLWRGLALVVSGPLALLSGWSFEARPTSMLSLVLLLAAELLAFAIGLRLARRGTLPPVVAAGAVSNSGFWSIPIAGALFGPTAIPFVALYDIAGIVRPLGVVRALRGLAPEKPRPATAAIDYLPQAALVVGLLLNAGFDPPRATEGLLSLLGIMIGVGGFLVLGAAMPHQPPALGHFRIALPALPLRFLLPALALTAVTLIAVDVPPAAWVIALSPSAFMTISLGRLYGYDQQVTMAIPLMTVPLAVAFLPLVNLFGS